MDWMQRLGPRLNDAFLVDDRYKAYLEGLKYTIEIALMAILIGCLIGVVIAIIKVSASGVRGLKWLNVLCDLYITLIRGTPLVLQLLIIYNLIFTARDTNEVVVGAVCFGINSGAYVAEIVRAGIESIDKGQMEAGRSLGFNHIQTMFYIILPQAIKNILPALGNEFIVLIKETSVAGYIAVPDLAKNAQYVGSRTYDVLPPLFIAAAFYLIIVLGLTWLLKRLERRMGQGDRDKKSKKSLRKHFRP
ncbi:amino acid ABC transporter permease [Anaeromicropila populeti]